MIMQVVPSDSKNDLLMDLISTKAAKNVKHAIVALNPGTGELSAYCSAAGIPIIVLDSSSSIMKKLVLVVISTRKFRPDVIYYQSFIPSLIGGVTSLIPNRRYKTVAVRHHNLNHHLRKNRRAIFLDCLISVFIDQVVAVSKSVSSTLLLEGCSKKKIVMIENGLNYERYDFALRKLRDISKNENLNLLAVGRLDWQKNFPLLLEIATCLNNMGIEFTINVLGDGNSGEREKWIERTQVLGLESRVIWHGWVTDVTSYFNKSDIFLHTAADEACPLVHIEALFSGIPIVSTANGGCKDVLNGFYRGIAIADPNEYVKAIVDIMNDYINFQKVAQSYILVAKNRFDPEISAKFYFA